MRASVSRTHDEAAKDPEWPGADTRKWTQTLIQPLPAMPKRADIPQPPPLVQTKLDSAWLHERLEGPRVGSEPNRVLPSPVPPLSPSLQRESNR